MMAADAAQRSLAAIVADAERRLERMLGAGWRNAASERSGLPALADELTDVGLPQLADRLRAVAQAADAAEALARITVAIAACRMLQARLTAVAAAPATTTPLVARHDTRQARLLVVAPVQVDGQPVWTCARLERGVAVELVLLAPPPEEPGETAPEAPRRGFLRQLVGPAPASSGSTPWLRAELHTELSWKATLPLADGAVDLRSMREEAAPIYPEAKDDFAARMREVLHSGNATDHDIVVRAGGALRLRIVERALAATYAWIDPSQRLAFDRAVGDQGWAIAWVTPQALTPLAIVRPGGLLRRAQLVPLTPGATSIPLAD